MKAKTYQSDNNFTAPQSISTFGISIRLRGDLKHLGLEEFNFCKTLRDFKFNNYHLAYIPCYSTCLRPNLDKLDLFFSAGNSIAIHYATLFDVEQLTDEEISELRDSLLAAGFPNFVENSPDFQNNYQNLFEPALAIWKNNFNQDNILARGHNPRFVLNVKYKSIQFHSMGNIVPWANFKRARALYA
jgi:hypothetical protein